MDLADIYYYYLRPEDLPPFTTASGNKRRKHEGGGGAKAGPPSKRKKVNRGGGSTAETESVMSDEEGGSSSKAGRNGSADSGHGLVDIIVTTFVNRGAQRPEKTRLRDVALQRSLEGALIKATSDIFQSSFKMDDPNSVSKTRQFEVHMLARWFAYIDYKVGG